MSEQPITDRPVSQAVTPEGAQGTAERHEITEDWLRSVGFKWAQFDRQPQKQWILWLGDALQENHKDRHWRFTSTEDLGIQICAGAIDETWNCWLRADTSHRYHRFIHVRTLKFQDEVAGLVEALTGYPWKPENHINGCVETPEVAARLRADYHRLDRVIAREQHPWYDHEKDGGRAKALPEHIDAAIKGGLAK